MCLYLVYCVRVCPTHSPNVGHLDNNKKPQISPGLINLLFFNELYAVFGLIKCKSK